MGETQKDDVANDDKIDAGEDVSKSQKETANNDNDSSDDEQGEVDNDATGVKLKSRKMDETEYDDPDEAEEIDDGMYFC